MFIVECDDPCGDINSLNKAGEGGMGDHGLVC